METPRRRLTQREIILLHLEQRGPLTAWQAMRDYGIMRLAARIEELRRAGYPIRSTWATARNRYGDFVGFVEYKLRHQAGSRAIEQATGDTDA